ncbi:MFS transporter [Alicyclobacillus mengziensis]|uniref:MFS transporter n=1 Tax=Alicyclobacillus mengziensis TaxID=2931921 RepID=A0A9X7Z5B6_9BACL|nr:MFS transporter [Alicyclobacillus mengziensis]QSO46172.1 MFS transporter [Alicyclobacillus mengziensis]
MGSIFSEYRDILKGAHRNVRLYFLASFLAQFGMGFAGILYNLYIKSLGFPDTVAGAYVSASSLASTLSLVPAGIISDRIGRRTAVLFAGALSSIVMMGQALANSPWLIVMGAFAAGMVSSVIWVSALPLLAENTEKEDRFHLFSVNFGITLVAQVVGSVASGSLAQGFGSFLGPVWSIRLTLLIGAFIALFSLIPFSKIEQVQRPRVRRPMDDETDLQSQTSRSRGLSRQPKRLRLRSRFKFRGSRAQLFLVMKFAVASTLVGFGAGLVIPYLNLYFAERFHMTKVSIGIVIGLAQAVTALAMFIGPALARRIGPVKAAVTFQMSSIPFLLTTAYATNAWLASGAVVVRNALMNAANPIQDSVMMALVSEDIRGFAVSVGQTLWSLGWAVMGPVSTRIVHHYGSYTGYAIVFTATATFYLIGSVYYFFTFHRYESEVYEAATDVPKPETT